MNAQLVNEIFRHKSFEQSIHLVKFITKFLFIIFMKISYG